MIGKNKPQQVLEHLEESVDAVLEAEKENTTESWTKARCKVAIFKLLCYKVLTPIEHIAFIVSMLGYSLPPSACIFTVGFLTGACYVIIKKR